MRHTASKHIWSENSVEFTDLVASSISLINKGGGESYHCFKDTKKTDLSLRASYK